MWKNKTNFQDQFYNTAVKDKRHISIHYFAHRHISGKKAMSRKSSNVTGMLTLWSSVSKENEVVTQKQLIPHINGKNPMSMTIRVIQQQQRSWSVCCTGHTQVLNITAKPHLGRLLDFACQHRSCVIWVSYNNSSPLFSFLFFGSAILHKTTPFFFAVMHTAAQTFIS